MAIACLRLLIGCFLECLPERMCSISVRTSLPAFLLYLRVLDFFRAVDFFFAGIHHPLQMRRAATEAGWQDLVGKTKTSGTLHKKQRAANRGATFVLSARPCSPTV